MEEPRPGRKPVPGEALDPKPGGPLAQYIRSGPEGARGVLNGRVCLGLYVSC